MFKDCAKLERNVFVTWKENDVNEQDVDERKEYWERKRVLSHIWVKSESDLNQISTRSLTSSNQSWYACNICKRSRELLYSMTLSSKLIWEWKSLFRKKEIEKMTENRALLSTNLIMSSSLTQSFCMYEQKNWRYLSTFWLTHSLWSLIWEW